MTTCLVGLTQVRGSQWVEDSNSDPSVARRLLGGVGLLACE
jgi:hypothetical protein